VEIEKRLQGVKGLGVSFPHCFFEIFSESLVVGERFRRGFLCFGRGGLCGFWGWLRFLRIEADLP